MANPKIVLAFLIVFSVASLVNLYCLLLYRTVPKTAASIKLPRWVATWEFTPQALGGFSYSQLALVSIGGLFLELLIIRWISSEIRIFAFFKNFVLVACYLGFGLGGYLSRRSVNLTAMMLPLIVLALICDLPIGSLRLMVDHLPLSIGGISEVDIWGIPTLPLNLHGFLILIAAVLFVTPIFGLIAFVFVPVGQLVGWLLENARNGITGYTVNILGSLVGIALYTLLCFLSQPPPIWFLLGGLILACLVWRLPRLFWGSLATFAICAALTSIAVGSRTKIFWSPYQKLALTPLQKAGEIVTWELNTNGNWYQHIVNLSPAFVASHPDFFRKTAVQLNSYNLPYRFYPHPASVLVLGAGMGNDVAAALRNGAGRVVAVEIDPLILRLGRDLHFEHPYSSPLVQVQVDDARSYIQNSDQRFDLIVFSLLDSHTTSSHYSNIRIDNYVYTIEALQETKRLLKPDGLMIIKFQVDVPWIAGRLRDLLSVVFRQPPLYFQTGEENYSTGGRFFVAGSQQLIQKALSDPQLSAYVSSRNKQAFESATLTTDDWPYFYQHEPGLPISLIAISVVLVLLCWMFLRQTGGPDDSLHWHFFFLGAGFLLLEAQIVSKMALLFGTTWVVNSIVIAGLMILIVAANLVVEFVPEIPISLAYYGIFASILLAYTTPLDKLFFASVWMKVLSATAVLCTPVFFAGIVFIRSFAREKFSGIALGSNLIGALLGGLLESISMWTGIRSLLILAALVYAASWLALTAEPAVVSESTG